MAETRLPKIASQFSRPRGLFGRVVGLILANRPSNVRRARWTVDRLALSADDRVLEIGCGPGIALEACLKILGDAGGAVGVDHSDVMIGQARRRNALAIQRERLRLVTGTIDDLSAEERPFDRIFSINVIQFIPDKEAFVAQCLKRLAPRGLLATTFQPRIQPTRDAALAMAGTLTEVKAKAGLTNSRTEVLELKPVPAICVLAQKA